MSDKSIEIAESIIKDDGHVELILAIVEKAENIFEKCGRPDDFCLQFASCFNIIFGGHNRLIWNPNGFRLDERYCSAEFIDKFNQLKGK
jgi:hypothetical protein